MSPGYWSVLRMSFSSWLQRQNDVGAALSEGWKDGAADGRSVGFLLKVGAGDGAPLAPAARRLVVTRRLDDVTRRRGGDDATPPR